MQFCFQHKINRKISKTLLLFNCQLLSTFRLPLLVCNDVVAADKPNFDRFTGRAVLTMIYAFFQEKDDLSADVLIYEYFDDQPYENYTQMMLNLGYRQFDITSHRNKTLYLFGKRVALQNIFNCARAECAIREGSPIPFSIPKKMK